MRDYDHAPDRWIIVHINTPKFGSVYKVLGGWYGGYARADSWRLSSGIVGIEETEKAFYITNDSGSVYYCGKGFEQCTMLMMEKMGAWQDMAKADDPNILITQISLAEVRRLMEVDNEPVCEVSE